MNEKTQKVLALLFLFFAGILCMGAQEKPRITIEDLQMIFLEDEQIEVSFIASSSDNASEKGYTYIYSPKIVNGTSVVSLKPIVVRSKLAEILWQRHEWASDTILDLYGAFKMKNKDKLFYKSTVAFQPWMYESSIEVQEIIAGYDVTHSNVFMLAEHAVPPYLPDPVARVITVPVRNEMSAGDSLAHHYRYVIPDPDTARNELLQVYQGDRTDYPTVLFASGSYEIVPSYRDNETVLEEYLNVIKTLEKSVDSRISRIVVAGFASPVGAYSTNDLLAWRRAISLKRIIVNHSAVPLDSIFILNGSADWIGLRETIMADDSIPNEGRAERIVKREIANSTELEKRMQLLRRTRGGKPYKHLQTTKGFDNLNRTYLRIYYRNESED